MLKTGKYYFSPSMSNNPVFNLCLLYLITLFMPATYTIWGGPIASEEVNDLEQNFWWLCANINTTSNQELWCNWNELSAFLGVSPSWQTAQGQGIMLKYMVDQSNPLSPYFSYAMVMANIDISGNVTPQPGATWFSLTPSGNICYYDTPEKLLTMESYVAAYPNIFVRTLADINTPNMSLVGNIINYPLQGYIDCMAVWQFYSDNASNIDPTTQLYLTNGAIYCEASGAPVPLANQYKAQTPIFYFCTSGSDLLNNTLTDFSAPFANKALENSRKCPPMCIATGGVSGNYGTKHHHKT